MCQGHMAHSGTAGDVEWAGYDHYITHRKKKAAKDAENFKTDNSVGLKHIET